jgi:hypothetical protein
MERVDDEYGLKGMSVIYISILLIYNKYIDIPGKQGKLKENKVLRNGYPIPNFLWFKERKK